MRLLLLDWMMEVCDEFGLTRETNHLGSHFTDLYLSKRYCPIEQLQLLGASALLLACKIEEIVCPRVRDFAYATDNGFSQKQIIDMEACIQKVINNNLNFIFQEMQFQLYPVTLNYWSNYYLAKWDIFVK